MQEDIYKLDLFRFKWIQIILFVVFLSWLFLYMFSVPIAEYCSGIWAISDTKEFAETIKIILNFIMASVVLCITCIDRYKTISLIKGMNKESIQKLLDKQFVPLIISLIPFTSASLDLGLSFNALKDTVFFILVAFIGITGVDILALSTALKGIKLPWLLTLNFSLYLILTSILVWIFYF